MLMVRKIVLSIVALLAVGFAAYAQTRQVSGTVKDEAGNAIVGASVIVDGTTNGATTAADGSFKISAPANAKLTVSFIGYEDQTVNIAGKTTIDVVLKEDAQAIEAVSVIGYGSANKVGTVIGSVAKVKGEVLENKPTANVADALQGKVAGLQVYTSSGEPTSASSIRLHGVGSTNAGTAPLILLDGAPITTGTMVMLNPNDIESVNVLKDASATSVYGARAANGVMYIVTKKGTRDREATITLNTQYGISQPATNKFHFMSGSELATYQHKYGYLTDSQLEDILASGVNTNWRKHLFNQNAPMYQVDLSVSGGSERTTYYVSGMFMDQQGTDPASSLHKYAVRSNVESKANKWLKLGMNLGLGYDRREQANSTQGYLNYMADNVAFGAIMFPTYASPYNEDGTDVEKIPYIGAVNPLLKNKYYAYIGRTLQVNASAYALITPFKNFNIKTQLSGDIWYYTVKSTSSPAYPFGSGNGSVSREASNDHTLTYTNTMDYQWTSAEKHNFYVLAGHESVQYRYDKLSASRNGQTDERMMTIGNGTGTPSASDDASEYYFNSAFGRLEYNFDRKYFFDASVRYDASSRFGASNRGATFYALGAMWDLKRENFLADSDALNALKLKVSYGTQGNADIDAYSALGLVASDNYYDQSGLVISTIDNPELSWETQKLFTVGVTAGLWQDRLTAEIEFYNRKTEDMLMNVPYPYTSGYASGMRNVGSMYNRGIDVNVSGDVVRTKDWLVNLHVNFSYNKNCVTKIFNGYDEYPMPTYLMSYTVGHDVGELYCETLLGVDPDDGKYMWAAIDPATGERTATKDYNEAVAELQGKSRYAPWAGGFGLNASWKGISIAADFSWNYGKYLVNNDRYFTELDQYTSYSRNKDLLNRWEKPGDVAKYGKFGETVQFDSHLIEDASFLRLKNLTVGYSLPRKWMDKTGFMKGVRIYFTARNLLTVTKYTGFDPEADTNLTYGRYPNSRQFVGGLQLTF